MKYILVPSETWYIISRLFRKDFISIEDKYLNQLNRMYDDESRNKIFISLRSEIMELLSTKNIDVKFIQFELDYNYTERLLILPKNFYTLLIINGIYCKVNKYDNHYSNQFFTIKVDSDGKLKILYNISCVPTTDIFEILSKSKYFKEFETYLIGEKNEAFC